MNADEDIDLIGPFPTKRTTPPTEEEAWNDVRMWNGSRQKWAMVFVKASGLARTNRNDLAPIRDALEAAKQLRTATNQLENALELWSIAATARIMSTA